MSKFTENEWNNPNMLAKERDVIRKNILKELSSINPVPFSLKCKRPDIFRQITVMITRHPDYNTTRFNNIKDIEVKMNAMDKKNLEFWIINDIGSRTFSLRTCCKKNVDTPQQSQEYKLKQAMRSAILPQIQNFKNNEPAKCYECKKSFDPKVLEVDHRSPLTFKILFKIFCEQVWKKSMPVKFRKSYELNDGAQRPENAQTDAFLEEDREINNAWCKFHENNCDLRLLCKPCHLKSLSAV